MMPPDVEVVDHRRVRGPKSAGLAAIATAVYQQVVASDEVIEGSDHDQIRPVVERNSPLLTGPEIHWVSERVMQQLFGLGPLQPLLEDPEVSEIMVNGPGRVWVERGGDLCQTEVSVDHQLLEVIIGRIVGPLGLRVDRTAPFVDARLPDGSRVHVAVPPLALDGPYLTVRRFRATPLAVNDFCSESVSQLLTAAVHSRQSLLVSGATGAGKTSLLNSLGALIPARERVITIEDAAELRLPGRHVVRLEARPPNSEGVGAVSVRALVRNALRMRPDRIVIGEVRGAEAMDMVQAMNTGHPGSMSTCHADSPPEALRRVEAMAMMSDVGLPLPVVREHVASAVSMVVQVRRGRAGRRSIDAVYRCGSAGGYLVQQGVVTTKGYEWIKSQDG